jgi:hypothetical protein
VSDAIFRIPEEETLLSRLPISQTPTAEANMEELKEHFNAE